MLQRSLSHFVLEVKTEKKMEHYIHWTAFTTLHVGIMRFIRQNDVPEIDFFKEAACAEFRATLDAELKHLKQAGNGSRKRKVEPLTQDICFAPHSGDEHHCLRYNDSQIQVVEKPRKACFPHLY